MNLNKSSWLKLSLVVGGGITLAWLLNNLNLVSSTLSFLWGVFLPFVAGLIMAFLFNLPMRAVENRLPRSWGGIGKRVVAYLITLVLVLAVLTLIILLVIPELWQTIASLVESIPSYIVNIEQAIQPYFQYIPQIEAWLEYINFDWQQIASELRGVLASGATSLLTSAVGVATNIAGGTVTLVLGIVFSIYLLFGKEHLIRQLSGLMRAFLPESRYTVLHDVASLTSTTYSKFVSGQFTEALIVTALYLIALNVGGFQYALLISVFVGFTSLVPIIGATVGCIVGAFLLLISMGLWRTIAFVALFLIIQQIEGNLIYPRVVGSSIGLPPLWILLAVMVGGGVGGVVGMLFFIPLFSVVYTLLHRNAVARLAAKGITLPALPKRKKKKHNWFKHKAVPTNDTTNTTQTNKNDTKPPPPSDTP